MKSASAIPNHRGTASGEHKDSKLRDKDVQRTAHIGGARRLVPKRVVRTITSTDTVGMLNLESKLMAASDAVDKITREKGLSRKEIFSRAGFIVDEKQFSEWVSKVAMLKPNSTLVELRDSVYPIMYASIRAKNLWHQLNLAIAGRSTAGDELHDQCREKVTQVTQDGWSAYQQRMNNKMMHIQKGNTTIGSGITMSKRWDIEYSHRLRWEPTEIQTCHGNIYFSGHTTGTRDPVIGWELPCAGEDTMVWIRTVPSGLVYYIELGEPRGTMAPCCEEHAPVLKLLEEVVAGAALTMSHAAWNKLVHALRGNIPTDRDWETF